MFRDDDPGERRVIVEREAPGEWLAQAACFGMDAELFFPPRGGDVQSPKKVCRGCSVRAECLEFALANNEKVGIWGGMSERERRRIRRARSLRRRAA